MKEILASVAFAIFGLVFMGVLFPQYIGWMIGLVISTFAYQLLFGDDKKR